MGHRIYQLIPTAFLPRFMPVFRRETIAQAPGRVVIESDAPGIVDLTAIDSSVTGALKRQKYQLIKYWHCNLPSSARNRHPERSSYKMHHLVFPSRLLRGALHAALLGWLLLWAGAVPAQETATLEVELPRVILRDVPFEVTVRGADRAEDSAVTVTVGTDRYMGTFSGGTATISDVV
ncbi:MAG: hypothetical protein R3202_02275, partial [Candidatus Competibacterales bacterium]|nr:hypothetical protein [Candidatus Competibacterales bacterium]